MMISLDNYWLSIDEREALESLLAQVGHDMSVKDLYRMMDEIWFSYGCESSCYDEKKYANFTVILFGCSTVSSWSSIMNLAQIVLQSPKR